MTDCTLSPRQILALRGRFGHAIDLRKEFVAARAYVNDIHTGRPYKNFGRFFWNWCRRAEEAANRRQGRADQRAADRNAAITGRIHESPRELSRAELETMAQDDDPRLREFAAEELSKIPRRE